MISNSLYTGFGDLTEPGLRCMHAFNEWVMHTCMHAFNEWVMHTCMHAFNEWVMHTCMHAFNEWMSEHPGGVPQW
jgi:hypothetical protein